MHTAPLPVVSNVNSVEDEDECPVCLEPLSFSFRLPGEKPHVVPECGHALHEACFTAVYGPLPTQGRTSTPRKLNLGVCGVCRRPMKVSENEGGSKSNKLAALTGMNTVNTVFPGRDTPTNRRGITTPHPQDPSEDDPLDHVALSRSSAGEHSPYVIAPSIQLLSEFPTLTRSSDPNQPLTCIVVIELPGKRPVGSIPGSAPIPLQSDNYSLRSGRQNTINSMHSSHGSDRHARSRGLSTGTDEHRFPGSSSSVNGAGQSPPQRHQEPPYVPPSNIILREEDSPFIAITEDLHNRIIDWKGHPLSDLGPLQMYDLLFVRRDTAIREFYVYLFKEAIICAIEEKKRGLGRLLSNASTFTDASSISTHSGSKGVLRLKGRIYVRHIRNVTASSAAGEMSLTIDMEDELASFILVFKERGSLEAWKNTIMALVNHFRVQNAPPNAPPTPPVSLEEFGGSQKAMRVLSGATVSTMSTIDSLLNGSSRSVASSSTSQMSLSHPREKHIYSPPPKLAPLGEDDELSAYDQPTSLVTPYTSSGPSNSLTPIPHPPMDLIMIVSVPPPNAVPSTAQLKLRVIKASLDFTLASLAPRDRLSLVTYEVGQGGRVRKTPFLCVGKAQSRMRLARFIDGIGSRTEDDEFVVRGAKEEQTDVVNAVNHGYDVVLQRKGRNPIGGMILVSDTSDHTRRAQLDLVLARAEAANMPIHSFGYGRSHEPSSIWLMSSSTKGTYTYVKDWYDLRDCIAGCVGGMMSIGLTNMRLHMRVVDGHRFRVRKVSGGPSAIVASDGQNVDVDVGELRYGEKKEMLIELELDNTDSYRAAQQHQQQPWARGENSHINGMSRGKRAMNATDQFVQSLGLDSLAIDDGADFAIGMMDRMIDEIPVVEVDGSFFDPAAGKHVSRLAHPVLLTVTLMPMSLNSSANAPRPPSHTSDPVIVRRRMELLASEMISRALVLVTKGNFQQGRVIFAETKRILHTVLQTISQSLPPPNTNGGTMRNRKELLTLAAVRAMQAMLQDLQLLAEALEENVELFSHDNRKFGAQQAMILREQKAWSGRSATERLFWTADNSIELVSRSADWVQRE